MQRPWDQLKQYLETYIGNLGAEKFGSEIVDSPIDDANFLDPSLLVDFDIYPHIYDLIKSETKRSPVSISIFLGVDDEDYPQQVIIAKIQDLCRIYTELGRPIELFIGNWFSPNFNQELAIASLFYALNTESVLILDTGNYADFNHESFDLYSGYWQKNWQTPISKYQPIDLQELALQELDLQKEADAQNRSWLSFRQNWIELVPSCVEIFTALQLDRHFFLMGLPPLLPQLLNDYLGIWEPNSELEDIEKLIAHYYQNLDRLLRSNHQKDPNITLVHPLAIAQSLGHFQDQSFTQSQVVIFMENWLNTQNIQFPPDSEITDLVALIEPAFALEDWLDMQKLNACFAIIDLDCRFNPMNILYKEEFEFTVLRINPQGQVRHGRSNRAKVFRQPLEPNLNLEMVYVPSGILRMGSPRTEVGHEPNESPMHWVALSPFFIGKFPITQAQWRAIAQLPKINKPLDPNPSEFQGANRPVENVSWYDAVEFCDRLTNKTGINYRLPTEAEWEYTCRAGTKSPFCFGETMTSEIANYDGTYPYGFGAKGEYRQQTTTVGSFEAPNSYGIYDLHGQVMEWCADPWHDNYVKAPNDGKCWQEPDEETDLEANYRVLRGGSWFNVAGRCRAASRHRYGADIWLNHVGFRVALFP
jgi:formylglycine-generating enzyme required for sulfatase activity